MEKTFQLDQRESMLLGQLEQERTQALAVVGALSLDTEAAKKNLDASQERLRGFLKQAVGARGIDRYDNARAANGSLFVSLPDEPAPEVRMHDRLNGPASGLQPSKE